MPVLPQIDIMTQVSEFASLMITAPHALLFRNWFVKVASPHFIGVQEVVLKVAMMCGGCEGAVRRVLTKMDGKQYVKMPERESLCTRKSNAIPFRPAGHLQAT